MCWWTDTLRETLAAKDDLTWCAEDEKPDVPAREWISETLEKCKTMVGNGVGKLYAYIAACCFEAAMWPVMSLIYEHTMQLHNSSSPSKMKEGSVAQMHENTGGELASSSSSRTGGGEAGVSKRGQ